MDISRLDNCVDLGFDKRLRMVWQLKVEIKRSRSPLFDDVIMLLSRHTSLTEKDNIFTIILGEEDLLSAREIICKLSNWRSVFYSVNDKLVSPHIICRLVSCYFTPTRRSHYGSETCLICPIRGHCKPIRSPNRIIEKYNSVDGSHNKTT